MLGDRNWYFPPWLEWLPKLNVEGHEDTARPVVVPEVAQPVGSREDG